jgi:hypothetical protein
MSTPLFSLRWAFLVFLLAAASAAAQQVTLERESPLYAEPRLESSQVAQLQRGATGEVISRQGGWLNIKTAAGTGWLFSFNVKFPAQRADGGASGGAGLGRVFGSNRPSVTSTIGIRGLEEEDLKQASFNGGQMKLLDSFVASKQAAEASARAKDLAPARVDYLDAKK